MVRLRREGRGRHERALEIAAIDGPDEAHLAHELAPDSRFATEAFPLVVGPSHSQLDSDADCSLELLVDRDVDLAHAALAELPLDSVAHSGARPGQVESTLSAQRLHKRCQATTRIPDLRQ